MPKRSELPEELRPLRDYQAVAITTNGFRSDMAGLLNDIRAILGSSSRWPRVGAGLAAVVALAAGIWGATYLRPSFYPPPYASRPLIEIIKASTDRNELVELLRQYPAELPAIVTRLNELGYVQVVTETSGERWLKAGGGNEATERFNDCRANEIWCPEMVVLPAGKFMMGSTEGRPDEKPVHEVTIARPFAVGKFEVTFAEWEACVAGGGCASNKSPNDEGWGKGRRPVINVSWSDAKEYVTWLARNTGQPYRLLTEAEWEYAARAGTTTKYAFGNTIDQQQAQYSETKTAEVGSFQSNAWGLHDMYGNVWEWVEDCYRGNYNGAPFDGSARSSPNCPFRVLRGGSWHSNPHELSSAYRGKSGDPHGRFILAGFRVAMAL